MKHFIFQTLAQAKRLIVTVVGFTVLAVGIAMIVLPGPAIVVIPIGLAILATEFIWARKLLIMVKERIARMRAGSDYQNRSKNTVLIHAVESRNTEKQHIDICLPELSSGNQTALCQQQEVRNSNG